MTTTFTPDSPVTVTDTYVTGPQLGQFKQGVHYTYYLQLANAIYFNNQNLLLGLFNVKFDDGGTVNYQAQLTVSSLDFSAQINGSYALDAGEQLVAKFLTHGQDQPYNYYAVSPAILGDNLYIFVLLPDQKTIVIWLVTAADDGTLSMEALPTFQTLPVTTNTLSVATVNDHIHVYYPVAGSSPTMGLSKFSITSPTSNPQVTFTNEPNIDISGGPEGQILTLATSQVPVDGVLLNITDGSKNTWSLIEKDGDATDVTGIQSGSNVPSQLIPAVVSGNGPALDQGVEAALLYYGIGIGSETPINCLQASLPDRTVTGTVGTIGHDQPAPLTSIFTTDLYCKLPGATHNSLFRASLVGIMALSENALKLYAVATGSMIAQDPVKTNTSEGVSGLSPELQKAYYESYSLLGIILAPPPFLYYDQPILPGEKFPQVTITFSEEHTATITQEFKASFSAGGSVGNKIVNVGGSVAHAIGAGSSGSVAVTVASEFRLHSQINPPGVNTGKMLVSKPLLVNTEYKLYAPGGSDADYSFYMIEVSETDIATLEYNNQSPDDNVYSKGLNPVPTQEDIEGWKNNPPFPADFPKSQFDLSQLTGGHDGGSTSSLDNDQTTSISSSTKTEVKIEAGVKVRLFGFKSSAGVSWSQESKSSTTLHHGYSAYLPGLRRLSNPTSSDIKGYSLNPHLYHLTPENVGSFRGLLPDIYAGSSPWVISWHVVDIEHYD